MQIQWTWMPTIQRYPKFGALSFPHWPRRFWIWNPLRLWTSNYQTKHYRRIGIVGNFCLLLGFLQWLFWILGRSLWASECQPSINYWYQMIIRFPKQKKMSKIKAKTLLNISINSNPGISLSKHVIRLEFYKFGKWFLFLSFAFWPFIFYPRVI